MKAKKCFILSLLSLLTVLLVPHVAAQGDKQSVGLVLSGGGAKGIAHVGVIKALEENGIPIDYITGTSMGAIIGGLYACGYTPDEMMTLITSQYFASMSTGRIDPEFSYYFSREASSPQMFSVSFGGSDPTQESKIFAPQSLIPPTPMAYGFMEIFSPYTAQCKGDFDCLFVPYRCVASNASLRRKKVWSKGDLGMAVRSSMSFPLVFQAVEVDGDILYDGGIYDNFPVNVMESDFAPSTMIGVDVSSSSKDEPNSFIDQLELLVMQPQSYSVPTSKGTKIRVKLDEFSLLDFEKATQIYQIGYEQAISMMDSIKKRIHARIAPEDVAKRRASFKKLTPPLRFNKVTATGGNKAQNEYLEYLFKPEKGTDTIGADQARLAFYRAFGSGKINSLTPTATLDSMSPSMFALSLDAQIKKKFSMGFGGYITSSNNSYLYVRAGYSSLSFSSISANVEAWIGQSYLAGVFRANLNIPTKVPSAFRVLAVASRNKYYESEKLFYEDNEPTFVTNHQYFGSLGWAMAAGRTGEVETSISGGAVKNTFYQSNSLSSYEAGRDRLKLTLGKASVAYSSYTLDDTNFPTSGYGRTAKASFFFGKSDIYKPMQAPQLQNERGHLMWGQLDINIKEYFSLHKHWALGLEGQAVASTRKLFKDYYSSISAATAYTPTPASHNVFDPKLRANSFVAVGAVPVYKYNDKLSARLSASAFIPMRRILEDSQGIARHGRWFASAEFFGELDIVFKLPFATLSGYCNYCTSQSHLNVGLAFGIYLPAPSLL